MKNLLVGLFLILLLQACASYKQNIMFQSEAENTLSEVTSSEKALENYIIQPNDYLEIKVFTKKGELLIDPENKLLADQRVANNANVKPELQYLVQKDGTVVLPMVGSVNL